MMAWPSGRQMLLTVMAATLANAVSKQRSGRSVHTRNGALPHFSLVTPIMVHPHFEVS